MCVSRPRWRKCLVSIYRTEGEGATVVVAAIAVLVARGLIETNGTDAIFPLRLIFDEFHPRAAVLIKVAQSVRHEGVGFEERGVVLGQLDLWLALRIHAEV